MAEERGTRSQNGTSRRARKRLSGREAIERVRDEFPELLGHQIESVLGLEPDENSGWTVTVQVLELARIPHSTDVLGSYAVTLDKDGELTGCRRQRRYYRNQADED
jgi:hypothetical protein